MTKRLGLLLLLVASVAHAGRRGGAPIATPYSCGDITVAPQTARVDSAVMAPWRALATAKQTGPAWLMAVHAQLSRKLPRITTEERVWLQHYLLQINQRLDGSIELPAWAQWLKEQLAADPYGDARERARLRVVTLVRAIAPTAAQIAALGDGAQPAVAPVLGTALTQRATVTCGSGTLVHVAVHSGLLAFRPLRAGNTRALVSQLVAFDRDGQPHVTPIVDAIEMRQSDDGRSNACVVRAGDDGTLHAEHFDELVEHPPFVMKTGTGVGCIGCHFAPDSLGARDINGDELRRIDALRAQQVTELATHFWLRHGSYQSAAEAFGMR
ncbi:MAG TPA: hypothetical protein VIV11_32265 [Kofleriaceae bacterium]